MTSPAARQRLRGSVSKARPCGGPNGGLSPDVPVVSTNTAAVHQYILGGQDANINKYLTYCRETALPGGLVLAKSERLELRDNILQTW